MKHRSPLLTLAAVALAFAIMFIVNMTASPPGNRSSGTVNPPAVPAMASAANPSPTGTGTGPPSPEDSKYGGGSLNAAPANGDEGL